MNLVLVVAVVALSAVLFLQYKKRKSNEQSINFLFDFQRKLTEREDDCRNKFKQLLGRELSEQECKDIFCVMDIGVEEQSPNIPLEERVDVVWNMFINWLHGVVEQTRTNPEKINAETLEEAILEFSRIADEYRAGVESNNIG